MKKMNDKTFDLIILIIYVDDVLILVKKQSNVDKCKNELKSTFKMKEMEESKSILAIDIHRNFEKNRLWLNQIKYICCILDMFNIDNFKVVWITLIAHFKLFAAQCPTNAVEDKSMSCVSYEQVVDNLMYLMICTRFDIALAMYKMNKYMSNKVKVH